MVFLQQGPFPIMRHSLRRDVLFYKKEELRPSNLKIFLKGLLDVQHWAWTRSDVTPRLSIGGLITPILKIMHIPMKYKLEDAKLMDMPYLARALIIVGEWEERYGYSFKNGETHRIVLLLNETCTSFVYNEAIDFLPSSQYFHDQPEQPLSSIRLPKKIMRPARPI
ncbi:unnamed protein product [Cochlearia groenlandica]